MIHIHEVRGSIPLGSTSDMKENPLQTLVNRLKNASKMDKANDRCSKFAGLDGIPGGGLVVVGFLLEDQRVDSTEKKEDGNTQV